MRLLKVETVKPPARVVTSWACPGPSVEYEHSRLIDQSRIDAYIQDAEHALDCRDVTAALHELGKAVELTERTPPSTAVISTMRLVRLMSTLHRCKSTLECTGVYAAKTGELSRRVLRASAG